LGGFCHQSVFSVVSVGPRGGGGGGGGGGPPPPTGKKKGGAVGAPTPGNGKGGGAGGGAKLRGGARKEQKNKKTLGSTPPRFSSPTKVGFVGRQKKAKGGATVGRFSPKKTAGGGGGGPHVGLYTKRVGHQPGISGGGTGGGFVLNGGGNGFFSTLRGDFWGPGEPPFMGGGGIGPKNPPPPPPKATAGSRPFIPWGGGGGEHPPPSPNRGWGNAGVIGAPEQGGWVGPPQVCRRFPPTHKPWPGPAIGATSKGQRKKFGFVLWAQPRNFGGKGRGGGGFHGLGLWGLILGGGFFFFGGPAGFLGGRS